MLCGAYAYCWESFSHAYRTSWISWSSNVNFTALTKYLCSKWYFENCEQYLLFGGKLKRPDVLHAFLYVVLRQFEPIRNFIYSVGALLSIVLKCPSVSETQA